MLNSFCLIYFILCSKAEELLKKITSKKLNNTVFESLKQRLQTFRQWVDDYRATVWDHARQNTLAANRVSGVVSKRIERFNDVASNITDILVKATNEIGMAENMVVEAKTDKILSMYDDFKV